MKMTASLATLLVAISINSSAAVAQDTYPSRPVRIVVSLPAGSAPDLRARVIGNQLAKIWGRQVVVENRPGAGGALSVQVVLSAPADGYTVLLTVASVFTILPAQREKLPFDINRDLVPIALTTSEGMVFAVAPITLPNSSRSPKRSRTNWSLAPTLRGVCRTWPLGFSST
jgi:tripartite-type tricarboxylate transporter receptor subunit TctC